MKVNVYIASSIRSPKKKTGVVGFVIEAETSKGPATVTQFGVVRDVSENQSYLIALKNALSRIKTRCELVFWMDNRYIATVFDQKWHKDWIKRDWKTAKGKEIANKEEWMEIVKNLRGMVPEFRVEEQHSYRAWLSSEVERRAKKYV